jgi:TonB family protein
MIVLDSPALGVIVASLGWTLLHFLWQGAIAGVLFGIALAFASRSSARTRYRIGLFFLAALAVMPVVTFFWIAPLSTESVEHVIMSTAATTQAMIAAATGAPLADWGAFVEPYLPWTVLVWAIGVMLMTSRLLLEWRAVKRLTRIDVEPLPPQWQRRAMRLSEKLGVHRTVQVLQSARVHVPLVVGWLKPVILVPVSAFSGLTPWQLELILMHELAHVRRHDYIVNLIQVVVETLLFYHPVVRWVSRVVREEREHCCDDLVVARTGDALGYARALTELAGAQSLGLQTSVGSDGGKLLVRIKRIVVASEPRRVSTHWSVGMMLGVLGVSVSGLLQPVGESSSTTGRDGTTADIPTDAVTDASALASTAIHELSSELSIANSLPAPAIDVGETATTEAMMALQPVSTSRALEADRVGSAVPETRTPAASGTSFAGRAPDTAPMQPAKASDGAANVVESAASMAAAPSNTNASAAVPPGEAVTPGGAAPSVGVPPQAAPQSGATAGGNQVAAAKPVYARQPEFPMDARLKGIEGWVRFTYVIGRNGEVRDVQVLEGMPHKVFDSAVRRAVKSWRFEPILVDGVPTERQVTQTIEFALSAPQIDDNTVACTGTRLCRTTNVLR